MNMYKLIMVLILALAFGGLAVANEPPGFEPCGHGNTEKPCRPDPQPTGKDCEEHGPKDGGVNEDHCKPQASSTPTLTPSGTPQVSPSSSGIPSGTPKASPSSPTTPPSGNPQVPTKVPTKLPNTATK